jgi:hypothetical protein
MGTQKLIRFVRVKMTEGIAQYTPFCAQCDRELEIGQTVFRDMTTGEAYHLLNCRREMVIAAIKQDRLTTLDVRHRFGLEKSLASRAVKEVQNGSN